MDNRFTIQVRVKNRDGIHARPSMQIVEAATKFASDIYIYKGDLKVNGKSILDLLTLAASFGTELVIEAIGSDSEDAARTIAGYLSREFNFVKTHPDDEL